MQIFERLYKKSTKTMNPSVKTILHYKHNLKKTSKQIQSSYKNKPVVGKEIKAIIYRLEMYSALDVDT